jgi:hypothetical protein
MLACWPANAAVYRTPGYRGTHKVPRVKPLPPPPPIVLGQGTDPHVLVDAAGTGHIAFTTPAIGESVLKYCRLDRGQKTCSAQQSVIPPDNDSAYGNGTATDEDFQGPFPLSVGNELLLLDHRCCNEVPFPDGSGSSSDMSFLYTSEDGGQTLTGPGLIGTQAPSGNAIVYGGNDPHIGVISDTQTGGTFFQGSPAGAFTNATANLGNLGPDEAYGGRVALDGDRPIAAFADLTGHIFVREYNGTGDINDPSNWSVAQMPGESPHIVGGPAGVWLGYQTGFGSQFFARRIAGGVPTGSSFAITPKGEDTGYFQLLEDAGGRLTAGWIQRGNPGEVTTRTSSDGVHWSSDTIVARGQITGPLALGAAQDGGGFAAFELGPGGSQDSVAVAAFGAINGTGQKGLGQLDGGGLGTPGGDQLASASCTDVHFGAIDALAEQGCFLRDPSNPNSGAAVTDGQIRLNGLEIIPDAGVRIVIDPRQHTINTTGSVSVVLRAPVFGDLTIWHGELHADLSGSLAGIGQNLFDFSTSDFPVSLKGFPIEGSIDVKIAHDAVEIPISLKLPSYMGGISGAVTLRADNVHGFDLTSLHLGVDDLQLGALEVKNLHIDYTEDGDRWTGGATLFIPGGTPYFGISVQVEFDHGDFTMGSFNVMLPFPGVPIFTDAYLASFGGGFDIHPPKKKFFGTITVGAIPLDPPNYTFTVTGTVSITFIDNGPVILEVDGSAALHGFQIATAKLVFQTNGYFEIDGNIDIDLDVAELNAGVSSFIDLPAKEFSAEVHGDLDVLGESVASADGIISSTGVGACGSLLAVTVGFGYVWGGDVHPILGIGKSCDLSAYRVQPVSNRAGDHGARSAHAASAGIPIAAGTMFEDITVTGDSGPPNVVLGTPGGQQVTPAPINTANAQAVSIQSAKTNTTLVMIPHPAAGTWQVNAAAGSPAIVSVQSAQGLPTPVIKARVRGHGGKRRLVYSVPVRQGLSVSFAEQAGSVYHSLGVARKAHGTLRFLPASGPGGRRSIVAIVSQDGIPRERPVVAGYTAPPPPRPGRVHALRVRVRRHAFRITFGSAQNAARYMVHITGSDGRHLVSLVGARGHKISLPALGYTDRLTVAVAGVSALNRTGRSARASAKYVGPIPKHSKPRKRHHRHKRHR